MESELQKVLRRLPKLLEANPRAIKQVLSIATDSLSNYEETLDKERNWLAKNAIRDVLYFSNDSPTLEALGVKSVPHMIDAMYFNFPEGKVKGHSLAEKKAFYKFRDNLIKGKYLDNPKWLRNIKGRNYFEWAKRVDKGKLGVKFK